MTVGCNETFCRITNTCRLPGNCTWIKQLESHHMSRASDWMQMADGSAFFPVDVRPWDFYMPPLIEQLAKQARFNGATPRTFYSVAQHCVIVSHIVPQACALGALLHDLWEGISSDVIRPIKTDPVMYGFREIEYRGEQALAERFGIEYPWCPEIRLADNIALATEKRDLMAPAPRPWQPLPEPMAETIVALDRWQDAESLYIARFEELTGVKL